MSGVIGTREVCAGELAMIPYGGTIIRSSGVLRSLESSEPEIFPIDLNICLVKALVDDALVAGRVVRLFGPVLAILNICGLAKISSTIVERVSILVVYLVLCAKNFTVHLNRSIPTISPIISNRYPTSASFNVESAPIPLHKPIVISSINDCVFVPSKGDKAIRWIERLLNRMSRHEALHGLSVTEIVQRVAALNSLNYSGLGACYGLQ